MLVSLQWLKDYVDINMSAKEFCDKMIMSGSNLETCTEIGIGIKGVKIGRIIKIEQHPDADRLVICQLDLGEDEPTQIVTGATNIFEGAYVPVAVHGSHIPGPLHGQPKVEGGVKITKGKLRGITSNGMLCSIQELGYDDKVAPLVSKEGIWILPDDFAEEVGKDITEALELEDYAIDFEITPNRPDCLSMLGMAREAAATFNEKMKYPNIECNKIAEDASDYIKVTVKSDLCKRYTARVIKDVKIEQSPWWLQKRLIAAGMRPINNMVDITNFVMLEYGQPLHAFDIRSLAGQEIIVDTAVAGEKFVTLDGEERQLDDQMLMINDGEKPVAVAGVMGGLNSEILDDTSTVVIESANFEGDSVRFTSKKLGLRTEASGRYEKGIDPNLCEAAADRVCKLIEMVGAGTIVGGSVDVYKNVEKAPTVKARVSRINKVLGIDITREDMVDILERLEIKVEGEGDILLSTPPSVRQDLLEEVDYVEEVGRIYGYDKLPLTLPVGNGIAGLSRSWILRDEARKALCAMGANEIQTYSFANPKSLDNVRIDEDSWERAFVKIINPMGEENAMMRTILTPNMLEVLGRNFSRNIDKVRAYEIGTTFIKNFIDEKGLPEEDLSLCIGTYGEKEDFFALKGMVVALLNKLGIKELDFIPETEYGVYHPGRCARIQTTDRETGEKIELGIMGEVHPQVAENYGIDVRCYCCEIMFNIVEELSNTEITYRQPPKYPSTSRDIALIVDEDLSVGELEDVIKAAGKDILRHIKLFDIYRGQQVDSGKKSVAFSLTYRHDDKTLTDKEVEVVHNKVLEVLKDKFGAVQR